MRKARQESIFHLTNLEVELKVTLTLMGFKDHLIQFFPSTLTCENNKADNENVHNFCEVFEWPNFGQKVWIMNWKRICLGQTTDFKHWRRPTMVGGGWIWKRRRRRSYHD